jgi:hypothetical protein
VFQDYYFTASEALQEDSEISSVETTPFKPSFSSISAGCSSRISVSTISPLPKAVLKARSLRKSQGTQRATVIKSSPL